MSFFNPKESIWSRLVICCLLTLLFCVPLATISRNLPFKISADEMYDIFGKYGAIRQVLKAHLSNTHKKCTTEPWLSTLRCTQWWSYACPMQCCTCYRRFVWVIGKTPEGRHSLCMRTSMMPKRRWITLVVSTSAVGISSCFTIRRAI